jgi:hypothetical protein
MCWQIYILFMNIRGFKKCMLETLGVLNWTWKFSSIFTPLINAFWGFQLQKYDFDLYKLFSWKKLSKFPKCQRKNFQIDRFSWEVPITNQNTPKKTQKIGFFSTFIFVCNQIWLNHLTIDHHEFCDNTKLKTKLVSQPPNEKKIN